MENLFLKAARNKFRFKTTKGLLNVEQLFELSKTELDKLYRELKSQQEQMVEGLIGRRSNTENDDKLSIVKYVFETIVSEEEAKKERIENKAKKEKILELIEEKEGESLKNKSLDELKKMAQEM
jgi:hypothetical protein